MKHEVIHCSEIDKRHEDRIHQIHLVVDFLFHSKRLEHTLPIVVGPEHHFLSLHPCILSICVQCIHVVLCYDLRIHKYRPLKQKVLDEWIPLKEIHFRYCVPSFDLEYIQIDQCMYMIYSSLTLKNKQTLFCTVEEECRKFKMDRFVPGSCFFVLGVLLGHDTGL